jgi:hypothetical protein
LPVAVFSERGFTIGGQFVPYAAIKSLSGTHVVWRERDAERRAPVASSETPKMIRWILDSRYGESAGNILLGAL